MEPFLCAEMSFINITVVDAMDEGVFWGLFDGKFVVKGTCSDPFKGMKWMWGNK